MEAFSSLSSALDVVMARRLGDADSPLAIDNLVDPTDTSFPVYLAGTLVFLAEVRHPA